MAWKLVPDGRRLSGGLSSTENTNIETVQTGGAAVDAACGVCRVASRRPSPAATRHDGAVAAPAAAAAALVTAPRVTRPHDRIVTSRAGTTRSITPIARWLRPPLRLARRLYGRRSAARPGRSTVRGVNLNRRISLPATASPVLDVDVRNIKLQGGPKKWGHCVCRCPRLHGARSGF